MKRDVERFVKNQKELVEIVGEIIGANVAWCSFCECFNAMPGERDSTTVCVYEVKRIIPDSVMIFGPKINKTRIIVEWYFFFQELPEKDFDCILKTVRQVVKTNVVLHTEHCSKGIISCSFNKNPGNL